jgi:transcriptional regulator with XRE-family HTH domain
MPRKTISPAEAINPMQRMFGTFLRLERSKLNYSSAYVAGRLGLTDTYLRLAESGRSTLNQSLAFKIIEVFAHSTQPTYDTRSISFNRLALFMVGMHWIGAEMASQESDDGGRRAAEALASGVNDFHVFFERTGRYFDLLASDELKAFLETVAAPEVGEFLRSESYGLVGGEDFEKEIMPVRELLDLPTLNIDLLQTMKQELAGRSFVHTAEIASKWESRRAAQFRSEHGLFQNANLIVTKENLDCFHYEHLTDDRFDEVQMIFMTSKEKAPKLREKFVGLLNAARAKTGRRRLEERESDKIKFLCPTPEEIEKYGARLDYLRRRDVMNPTSPLHDAYWSFVTHAGLNIGFVGWIDNKNPETTRNLTLKDSHAKARAFKNLWEELYAAHPR